MIEAWLSAVSRVAIRRDLLYLTLLEFGSDCSINVLYPPPGINPKPLQSNQYTHQVTRIGQMNESSPGVRILFEYL